MTESEVSVQDEIVVAFFFLSHPELVLKAAVARRLLRIQTLRRLEMSYIGRLCPAAGDIAFAGKKKNTSFAIFVIYLDSSLHFLCPETLHWELVLS